MAPPRFNFKSTAVIAGTAAGITLGAVVGYILYRNHRSNCSFDDMDEGIGDVDSIISEGEVEGEEISVQNASISARETEVPVTSEVEDLSNEIPAALKHDFPEQTTQQSFCNGNASLKGMKVLVLGLERCGKSCMLNALTHQSEVHEYKSTVGFNVVQTEKDGIVLNIMEVGGNPTTRAYWKNFTEEMKLLIYVVDGADSSRFKESKNELKKLLDLSTLEGVDCLLISNKQDMPEAKKADQIFTERDLNDIAKKGASSITLLNTNFLSDDDNNQSNGNITMDVIIGLLKDQ